MIDKKLWNQVYINKQSLASADEESQQETDTNDTQEGQMETDDDQMNRNDQNDESQRSTEQKLYATVLPKNLRPKKQPVKTKHILQVSMRLLKNNEFN